MVEKSSDHDFPVATQRAVSRRREPLLFFVSEDRTHLESVLTQCLDVPNEFSAYESIRELMLFLSGVARIGLAFVFIIEKSGDEIDIIALRKCKLDYPQLFFVVMLEECEQRDFLRFQSIGVQNILLPPFSKVSLTREIATALPNIPQFKRHPDLMRRGMLRLDFMIPSELSYVLGVNHLISMLLKEFGFPSVDARVNIPLACDEGLTNAILHGNGSNVEKNVTIHIYISAARFKMRIKDQGRGFAADRIENPVDGDNVFRPSGRGIYLMRSIMDRVEYKENGRVLELEKANSHANRTPPASHEN